MDTYNANFENPVDHQRALHDMIVAAVNDNLWEQESRDWYVCVMARYNHDWQHHVLIKVWDRDCTILPDDRVWEHSLWRVEDDEAICVREYPCAASSSGFLISAGALVACWLRHGKYFSSEVAV